MNIEARRCGRAIESVSKALAECTLLRHVDADPTLGARYGASWRADWLASVQSRLAYLALAVSVRQPGIFSAIMEWTRRSFIARDGHLADLRANLCHMRDALQNELPAPIAAPATACVEAAISDFDRGSDPPPPPPSVTPPLTVEAATYVEALLSLDAHAAERHVDRLLAGGLTPLDVCEHVLHPAQSEIGRLWHANDISVADEHFATATTERVMARLRQQRSIPPTRKGVIVVASARGDFHDLGARMLADFFEMDGWRVLYLGANVPNADVIDFVGRQGADVLALSAGTYLSVLGLGELIDQIRAERPKLRVLVGGPPFNEAPQLWQELGADGSAGSGRDAVALANALMGYPVA